MVPPLFLDVCPDHFVLDMCAAPGSKTFQLLEMIYHSAEPGSLPSGLVIANDVDVQRCNLLIHQTKRMCTANLIVTNHEAQHFPSCHLNRHYPNGAEMGNLEDPHITQLLFDRVLCDVPCSGDGTLRKAPDIWRKWNVGMGNGYHGLQVQIAMRGMSLLKVGGRMVYSTCSMNPIENEAVVAEVLRRCGQSVELLDVSNELPHLNCRPGLRRWKVRDKGVWLTSYRDVPKPRRAAIVPGMFPSGKTLDSSTNEATSTELCDNGCKAATLTNNLEEEISAFPLEHCMRIVPHDQNTGAFFIAVFHKLSHLPVNHKELASQPEKLNSNKNIEIEGSATEITEASKGLELKSADTENVQFPEGTKDTDLLDIEVDDPASKTKFGKTSQENENSEMVGRKRKLQMQGKWRGVDPVIFYREKEVTSKIKDFYGIKESLPFDGHLITRNSDINHVKRVYYISKSVKEVLELNFLVGQQLKIASVGLKMFYKSIKFADFVDAAFGEKASKLLFGCCVVVLDKDKQVAIGCWRGRTNISVMVSALDCQELLERMPVYMEEDTALSLHQNKPSFLEAEEDDAEILEKTET